jgi:hypothetical protein
MSLNTALFLVAALAFLAIVVAQVRWLDQDSAIFSRKRRRAAWAFGALLLLLGLVGYGARGGFDWLLAPDEDGSWQMVLVNGQNVARREFVVGIGARRVVGGLDDCNSWGFEEQDRGKPVTERMIVTTLALCPEDDPARRAYRMITMSEPVPRLRPDGSLELAARGHRAILRRCTWTEVHDQTSRITRCLIE